MSSLSQQEVNVFLDILRHSGVTNMWGAGQYIEDEFGVSKSEAKSYLLEWMRTFGERMNKGEVVDGSSGEYSD